MVWKNTDPKASFSRTNASKLLSLPDGRLGEEWYKFSCSADQFNVNFTFGCMLKIVSKTLFGPCNNNTFINNSSPDFSMAFRRTLSSSPRSPGTDFQLLHISLNNSHFSCSIKRAGSRFSFASSSSSSCFRTMPRNQMFGDTDRCRTIFFSL